MKRSFPAMLLLTGFCFLVFPAPPALAHGIHSKKLTASNGTKVMSVNPPRLRLRVDTGAAYGKITLTGKNLGAIQSYKIFRGKSAVSDVTVSIVSSSPTAQTLRISAKPGASAGGEYRLKALLGQGQMLIIPVFIRVIKRTSDAGGFKPADPWAFGATPAYASTSTDSQDAIDLLETAMDAYAEVDTIIRQLSDLARVAVTRGGGSRAAQLRLERLISRIDSIADSVTYEDRKVLQGTSPEFLSSSEGSPSMAGTPWDRIVDAVTALDSGNASVTFTFSFMLEGTQLNSSGTSLAYSFGELASSSLSADSFQQEIAEAQTVWEDLLEKTFNTSHGYGGNLEVRFIDLGDELGNTTGSYTGVADYAVPGTENLGNMRHAMEDLNTTAAPYSPTDESLRVSGYDDEGGDVHYDTEGVWREDRDTSLSATSVKIVAAHEIGHGLAFGHDETTTDWMPIMNPHVIVRDTFRDSFPGGLFFTDSSTVSGAILMYGSGATTSDPGPFTFDDGTEVELSAVSAAALGINAIKIRTVSEGEEAMELLQQARIRLREYKAAVLAEIIKINTTVP